MGPTNRIAAGEVVLKVMTPFMHDDVIVEFLGVQTRVAQQVQGVIAAAVERGWHLASRNVEVSSDRIVDTPKGIHRGKHGRRVSAQHQLDA